jgi:hypothetical protein
VFVGGYRLLSVLVLVGRRRTHNELQIASATTAEWNSIVGASSARSAACLDMWHEILQIV